MKICFKNNIKIKEGVYCMGMTNEQLLQSITTVIVDRFDMLMENREVGTAGR